MAKKTLGYVNLVWTCPRCATQNPGPQKFCNGCGAPQPDDVQFEQAAEEKLLTDPEAIARAKAGPDIHCPYCNSRNPGRAKFCGACGGDLAGGKAREKGKVLGAFRSGPAPKIRCPSCGTENPGTALTCSNCGSSLAQAKPQAPAPAPARAGGKLAVGPLAIGALVLCGLAAVALLILAGRRSEVIGQVQDISWSRSVSIMALAPVERQTWWDEIPYGAETGACTSEYRYTSDVQVPDSVEVCGTPYTVDTGSGVGEVVQDCVYEVYDQYCSYTVEELTVVDTLSISGTDLAPHWPEATLSTGQELGEGQESYSVTFAAEDSRYDYAPQTESEFRLFEPGSTWSLQVDGFGNVVGVEPVE